MPQKYAFHGAEIPQTKSGFPFYIAGKAETGAQMQFLDTTKIVQKIPAGSRAVFLLRHAKRRHILPEDPEFGSFVPITEEGLQDTLNGASKLPKAGCAKYFASPVLRCRETAAAIASARHDSEFASPEKVQVIEKLGCFFAKDLEAHQRILGSKFYQTITEYLKNGSHPDFVPICDGAAAMLSLLERESSAEWNFFVSHDAWIIPCLQHFFGMKFSPKRWLNFLSGMAVVFTKNKRPELYPVTLMESGILNF